MTKGIPLHVRRAYHDAAQYFPTPLQHLIYADKYSRFDHSKGRRETWIETVDRSVAFLRELSQNKLDDSVYRRIRQAILEMRAMPSMRLLAMAGDAARRNHLAIYNCSYLAVNSIDAFVEALTISMAGCGVGYSVERKYTEQLPEIRARRTSVIPYEALIEDSAEGWAEALLTGLRCWFNGYDAVFDYSLIRPAGAVLKVKGGRASGPGPLKAMLDFCRGRILAAQGRKLTSLECHDIMCIIGNAAVSGGVRRTALISLFDVDDQAMLTSKDGDFETYNSQRWNANNSGVWTEHLTHDQVADYMRVMDQTQRGEPGIFSRRVAQMSKPARRQMAEFGTNPLSLAA